MKILVTGGAGFVGSHLVDKLINDKHEVVIIDDLSTGKKEFINKFATFYKTDIRNKKISKIFDKHNFDIVYHIAAQKSVPYSLKNPIEDADINILGALNLLDNCVKYKIEKIIFTSTGGAIYDAADFFPTNEECEAKPLSPYAVSKFAIEKYLNFYQKVHGLNYVIIRPANIYGPRQDPHGEAGVIAIFISNLLQNKQCYINGGDQSRDFVYVKDVVNALILAQKAKNEIYNIGTSNDISIINLYEKIRKLTNSNLTPEYKPSIKGEVVKSQLSSKKIKEQIGWTPKISLNDGILETIEYFKNVK
ncbi:MAG TPA: NAD-dependent epimerase/dehydratase family protein [bacterium]|jgi:UDP-glucose 4-epimerase|nr:NAD-dependent epimerase/dehydratase family protein [bacterium]HOG38024.1 NAD-dependent epimerase/dehydratase family protein [bacterium]